MSTSCGRVLRAPAWISVFYFGFVPLYQSQRRAGVQIQTRGFAAHQPIKRRAADHRRVVRAENRRRHHKPNACLLAFVVHRVAQAAVTRHAARQCDRLCAGFDGSQHRFVAQKLHRRMLKTGGDIRGGHVLPVLAQFMHRVDERRFQAGKAVIIASRRLYVRQFQRVRVALAAELVQQRPARIRQSQHARRLVKSSAASSIVCPSRVYTP